MDARSLGLSADQGSRHRIQDVALVGVEERLLGTDLTLALNTHFEIEYYDTTAVGWSYPKGHIWVKANVGALWVVGICPVLYRLGDATVRHTGRVLAHEWLRPDLPVRASSIRCLFEPGGRSEASDAPIS
ncbi:hypothetical protein PGQ11_009018 [Apiospora arundinis]|uniref:Uncharacterized protein n=1 Tax=Apiospora arundinis TaxID=335852 RepID=A0ABR2IHN1_9PEZI